MFRIKAAKQLILLGTYSIRCLCFTHTLVTKFHTFSSDNIHGKSVKTSRRPFKMFSWKVIL